VPVTDLPALFAGYGAGLRLGVATNDSELALRAQIRRLEIDSLIDFFCGYDSGHGAKRGRAWSRRSATAWHCRRRPSPWSATASTTGHGARRRRGPDHRRAHRRQPARDLAPHADHVIASIAEIGLILSGDST